MAKLEDRIKELTAQQRLEVENFVETLLHKDRDKGDRPIGQSWAGGLKDLRDKHTSIELQKKANDWRLGRD